MINLIICCDETNNRCNNWIIQHFESNKHYREKRPQIKEMEGAGWQEYNFEEDN